MWWYFQRFPEKINQGTQICPECRAEVPNQRNITKIWNRLSTSFCLSLLANNGHIHQPLSASCGVFSSTVNNIPLNCELKCAFVVDFVSDSVTAERKVTSWNGVADDLRSTSGCLRSSALKVTAAALAHPSTSRDVRTPFPSASSLTFPGFVSLGRSSL